MNERRQSTPRSTPLRSPLLLALLAVGIVFFILMGVKALKEKSPDDPEPASTGDPVPALSTTLPSDTVPDSLATDSEPVTDTAASNPEQTTESPVEPSTEATETPSTEAPVTTTEAPVTTAEPAGPTMMTVDDSYFDDALFIGDSRTDGLRLYSPPGKSKFYCGTSMSIYKVMDSDLESCGFKGIRNLLQGKQFGKIYIMFGINECGYSTSSFSKEFRSVIEEIRSMQPDALIYIQSICYVTQKHEQNYPVFSTANLKEKNETLKALANGTDIFYLEVNDALNDGTDHLPSEYTGDGVHLKANCYRYWHDYLLEHAVVDEKHPWPAGE